MLKRGFLWLVLLAGMTRYSVAQTNNGLSDSFVTPPKPIKPIEPKYPKAAKKDGITGTVQVYLWIPTSGKPSHVKVVKGFDNALDQAALKAIEETLFAPAIQNGKAVLVDMYMLSNSNRMELSDYPIRPVNPGVL